MIMPLLISSSSNNQKQLSFSVSSNNYRNRGLSVIPSFNGGDQQVNGVSLNHFYQTNSNLSAVTIFSGGDQKVINGVSLNHFNQKNRGLSILPCFNGGDQQVINGVSLNHSNQTNRSLSVYPCFNGGDHQQVINRVSLNHSNQTNRSLSVVSSFNGGDEQVIKGVSLSYSNGIYRGLTLAPSFNDCERVMNNGITSSHYSSCNQQELGFSVSSSSNNHRNTSLSLVPSFNGYEPAMMSTGVSSSYSNKQNLGFSVSSSNYINRSRLSLVPGFSVTERRTKRYVRNYHFSYSARLLAMRKIVRACLISAFFARRRIVINQEEAMHTRLGSNFSSQINLNNSQQCRTRFTITELDEEACSDENQTRSNSGGGALAPALDPTPVSVYHPSRTNDKNDDDNGDEGITRSLLYKKYGPYTCPRCLGKFPTSQKFAAHASSHYKYETENQRRRRLMAKIRRRNLRLHNSRERITLVPTEPAAQPEPVNMVEAEARGDGGALSIVQIKEEPSEI